MCKSSPVLFGQILADTRRRLGVTQRVLSTRTGISERHLTMMEQGHVLPRLPTLIRLGHGLGIPPGDLLNALDALMAQRSEPFPPPDAQ